MASLSLPTIVLLALIYTCAESPRHRMRISARRRERRLRRAGSAFGNWAWNVFAACFCIGNNPNDVRAGTGDHDDEQDYRRAYDTLLSFRGHPILAAKELLHMHFQMVVEVESIFPERLRNIENAARDSVPGEPNKIKVWLQSPTSEPIGYFRKLRHLFSVPRIRRATVNAVVCMLSQQICGVNGKYHHDGRLENARDIR